MLFSLLVQKKKGEWRRKNELDTAKTKIKKFKHLVCAMGDDAKRMRGMLNLTTQTKSIPRTTSTTTTWTLSQSFFFKNEKPERKTNKQVNNVYFFQVTTVTPLCLLNRWKISIDEIENNNRHWKPNRIKNRHCFVMLYNK
jgi:hypothetical protein